MLKPCNSSLNMLTWPGTMTYQPKLEQMQCACNQNYYDLVKDCMRCQTSTTSNYTVLDLETYKTLCQTYGHEWTTLPVPKPSTTSAPPTATTTTTSSAIITPPGNKTNGVSHNNLSSGAIAGIIVSVVALIVALSVAGYVWNRRRKDTVRDAGNSDEYKYHRDNQAESYMESALPQYTGMIQPTLPPISNISGLRVMNPDDDDEGMSNPTRAAPVAPFAQPPKKTGSFEVRRNSNPGWRRGSFDDD
ncbi:hypothetical protein BGX34_000842 [Mortierella sp. NVP85]|nr:hypothetical protein BGX34_000842 [Mortierella sp. NVP85]